MSHSLGLFPIDEKQYKADLDLLDRYVGFSAELVRISLLGLAAIGFYLKEFVAQSRGTVAAPTSINSGWIYLLLGISAVLFGIATACGLLHRYYATDGMHAHLRAIRLSESGEGESAVCEETRLVRHDYKLAEAWLLTSEVVVAAAAGSTAIAFGVRFGFFPIPKWQVAIGLLAMLLILALRLVVRKWYRVFRKPSKVEKSSGMPIPNQPA